MKRLTSILICLAMLGAAPAGAQDQAKAVSLDQLLEEVRRGWNAERSKNAAREAEFKKDKANQQAVLDRTRADLAGEEARSEALEKQFNDNELRLAQLEETLQERLGTLGEAFGVVRQVAGDTRGHIENSLASAQLRDREGFLIELGKSRSLPSIESLEKLWFALQQEMTESGKVVRFPATVVTVDGDEVEREVVRIGVFNAVSGGKYLVWKQKIQRLVELARQPAARHLSTVGQFEAATDGIAALALDPSRGQILSVLVETPSAEERIEQGGPIGMAIIVLGILAGLLGLGRWVRVLVTSRQVAAQKKAPEEPGDNPLGRVLSIYQENRDIDTATLELKLDEAILRESARLERFLWAIKVVSVVAPLMGLLGTVTGMIRTFQAIVLFGTGNPKLMAGGISEALVTTMLGLCVAIPLVLLHAMISSSCKSIIDTVEEQSAGMIAQRAEETDAVA